MFKLMLADEQPVFHQGLIEVLKSNFVDCEIVEHSEESETSARRSNVKPDIIIIDVVSQNGKGIEGIRKMREIFPEARIIILSSSYRGKDFLDAIKAGASAYLLKTAKISEIVASIKAVINGENVLSPIFVGKLMREFRMADTNGNNQRLWALTPREREILQHVADGSSNKEIAEKCCLSVTTVKAHIRNILGKLEVKNRTGAVVFAGTHGLIDEAAEYPSLDAVQRAGRIPFPETVRLPSNRAKKQHVSEKVLA